MQPRTIPHMPSPKHERTHRLITKGLPLHLLPTEEDLERVDKMDPCECPRRYCWWSATLSLDWGTSIADGCTFDPAKHPIYGDPANPRLDIPPCKRLDPTSPQDHYEPRGPTFLEDGIPEGRWDCPQ